MTDGVADGVHRVPSPGDPLLLDDLPLERGLRPSLDRLANRIANVVQSAPLTSPILVSGDWGAGKTTLLRAVCRKLADMRLTNVGTPTVMFEAWQYESSTTLLPALMRAVWDATPAVFRAQQKAKTLLWELVHWAATVASRTLVTASSAIGLPGKLALDSGLGDAVQRGAQAMADVTPPGDPVDELRGAFAKLVAAAWSDHVPVVFIDDLDRCSPANTVALLDAIRSLASCAERLRVRFVAALDRGVVVQAISAKFANVRGYDGSRYLEKIFPIEFQVPAPTMDEIRGIIKEMAAPLEPLEVEQSVYALTHALTPAYFANARLIKRCFNRHQLVRYFDFDLGVAAKADDDKLLLQWIAATERWPRLRTLQQRRKREFWTNAATQETVSDPDLQTLYAEPGFVHWLAAHRWPEVPHALDVFDAADERLRRHGL
jgi:hypothetical protein